MALEKIPSAEELREMLGLDAFDTWNSFSADIDSLYDMERAWNSGGKKWDVEYKFRRGGRTLCALYASPGRFGLMIIFGRAEREKFDALRPSLSAETLAAYDGAETYHDGKWVMFSERLPLPELRKMLAIKRRPDKMAARE